MQRRPGLCLFCALASRVRPVFPQPASLHTSTPWLRAVNRSAVRAKKKRNVANSGLDHQDQAAPSPESFRFSGMRSWSPNARSKDEAQSGEVVPKAHLLKLIDKVQGQIKRSSTLATWGLTDKEKDEHWESFYKWLRAEDPGKKSEVKDEERAILWANMNRSYMKFGINAAVKHVEFTFIGHVASSKSFSKNDFYTQKAMADLRFPIEWYPRTRTTPRKIICHVGPTNSGKTYHALKRLEESGNGVYAGPLRLLAHEVFTRLNAKSLDCSLVTGEERRAPANGNGASLFACTVEMIPLNLDFEVAVIDEIQMIGDVDRGWAWTQALLGVQAKEIHVCGEERTVPLLRELAAMMGDSFEVNTYKRLTKLEMDKTTIGNDFSKLEKGDCIVAFTVKDIHHLRKQIEEHTKKKVAIVYGSLPPETRAAQARLFNDPDSGYDFLVASDAIGMGLNLSIKRIIFETTVKWNGTDMVSLAIPDIKQIAGRAGRFRTAHQDNQAAQRKEEGADASATPEKGLTVPKKDTVTGLVTAFHDRDFRKIAKLLQTDAEIITQAGLFPPDSIIERFANYFPPGTPFSYILVRLHDIARTSKRFRLCALRDQLAVADVIHGVEGLSITDRITFSAAPANLKTKEDRQVLFNMAEHVANQKDGALLNIEGIPWEILDEKPNETREYLQTLETLHKAIILYLWLSYRFAGVFTTRGLAFHAKKVVEEAIEHTLNKFSSAEQYEKRQQAKLARQAEREKEREELLANRRAEKEAKAKAKAEEREARRENKREQDILDGAGEGMVDVLDGAEEGADIRPVKHEEQPAPRADDAADDAAEEAAVEAEVAEDDKEKRLEAEEDESDLDASALDNPLEIDETEEYRAREEKEGGKEQ